jgi:hypothetical protein
MAMSLLAAITFLQRQTTKKVMVTSPCSKAQKGKTLTTYSNTQDMPLGHIRTLSFGTSKFPHPHVDSELAAQEGTNKEKLVVTIWNPCKFYCVMFAMSFLL